MFQSYFSRFSNLLSKKVRSSTTRRHRRDVVRAALAPVIDCLESRVLHAVFSGIENGQLKITDTSASDVITLDHSGTTTFINQASFPDSAITNGISIVAGSGAGGLDTINIRGTVKKVTIDGQLDVPNVNIGKNGSMQNVLAEVFVKNLSPSSFITTEVFDGKVNLNNGADTVHRNVTVDVVNGIGTVSGLAPANIKWLDQSFDELTINGGSGGNTFNVVNTPKYSGFFDFRDESLIINSGTGADTVNLQRNQSFFVGIHGQSGHDQVNIGKNGSVQAITGKVFIDNTSGFTDVLMDNVFDTTARTVTMDHVSGSFTSADRIVTHGLAPGEISVNPFNVSSIHITAGSGGNTFNIEDTAKSASFFNTQIDTGLGLDTVNVRRTTGKLIINGQSGRDVIKIGKNGSMLGIKGDVHVTNKSSFSGISVDGFLDTVSRIVTIDNDGTVETVTGMASGAAKVSFVTADVNALNLDSGSGADTIFVRGTRGLAAPVINAGFGDDLIVVASSGNNLDPILAPVNVFGGGGFDRLLVNDQGNHLAHTYTTTTNSVTRSGNGPTVTVNYLGIEDLDVLKSTISTGNPPPLVKDLAFPSSITAGHFAKLTGRLSDADGDTKLTLAIDWGDGSNPALRKPGQEPFSVKHKYKQPGTYAVRVIWTDSKGESNFKDLFLVVEAGKKQK